MQGSLRIVGGWCKTKELSISPEITEMLLFTRKRKTGGVVRLKHQSVKLNESNKVKYLCVILDDKVM